MKTITIGRAKTNRIVLDDPSNLTSRNHAEIWIKPNGSMVIVDKSTHGTTVNGKRITKGTEYYIYRGDTIEFAGKTQLDWDLVPIISSGSSIKGTNVLRDLRDLLDEVTGTGEKFKNIRFFFSLFKSGSDEIVRQALSPESNRIDAKKFFGIGSGLFIFSLFFFFKLNFDEVVDETEENVSGHFKKMLFDQMDFFGEMLLAVGVVLGTLIWAYLNYKVFRLFVSTTRRWRQYLRMYALTSGFGFIGYTFAYLPLLMVAIIDKDFETTTSGLLALLFLLSYVFISIWVSILWIKVNKKFWGISYWRVIGLFAFTSFVVSFLIVLVYSFFRQ